MLVTVRSLNRATLDRQLLLQRADLTALDAIEHLVGMQAQAPLAPYVGLWSRLVDFTPRELVDLLTQRSVVRASMMRVTVHLASAGDYRVLRPLLQPVMDRGFKGSPFAKELAGLDLGAVLAAAEPLVAAGPVTRPALASALSPLWPDRDAVSLAYAASYLLPMVQSLPRGVWGSNGPAAWQLASSWLGSPLDGSGSVDDLVLRYLAAFGPATVADVQLWSGLTRLREVVERLPLVQLTDEEGVVYHDLPDAPRPSADVPAPPRFLPEYDNVLLSHADRRRFIPDARRVPLPPGTGATTGTVLVDGLWSATWKTTRTPDSAALTVAPHVPLADADRAAVEHEAHALLAFTDPDLTPSVRVL